jgi:cell shape-determining protein MreC
LQSLKDILSVLAPFLLGLFTSYLSDKRNTRQDSHSFLADDYKAVLAENRELRKENKELRKELNNYEAKH